MSSCPPGTSFLFFLMWKCRAHVGLRATQSDEMPNSITAMNKKQEREDVRRGQKKKKKSLRDVRRSVLRISNATLNQEGEDQPLNWKFSAQLMCLTRWGKVQHRREKQVEEERGTVLLFNQSSDKFLLSQLAESSHPQSSGRASLPVASTLWVSLTN